MNVISSGPNGQLAATGTVVAVKGNNFQLESNRYFWVNTSSSTVYNDGHPAVGDFVAADGSSTTNGATMTSTNTVSILSPPSAPITATGVVSSMITGGFQIATANGTLTKIYWIYSTKYNGGKPSAGETVTVGGLGSLGSSIVVTSVTIDPSGTPTSTPGPTGTPTPAPTTAPTSAPTPSPTSTPGTQPAATAFMPSTWGKISAFQVFDDTTNGYVPESSAASDGNRYTAIWGARNNIGTSWLDSNPSLETGYYDALETDASPTSWGKIGHTLSWWNANHPDWVLYACDSSGNPTHTPAWVPGLDNVPLDVHNPDVVSYQAHLNANYAISLGYKSLSIDEVTFWFAGSGGKGYYPCGIWEGGTFVRRYSGQHDPAWETDVVNWVKQTHTILTTDPTISRSGLKLMINHPAGQLTSDEETVLANTDADLDETGFTDFGHYRTTSTNLFTETVNWAKYAQEHGTAVLMNANWGSNNVGSAEIDYSVATYLMGNYQAESLFAAASNGYGRENWHSQYTADVGAPCGDFYGGASYDASAPSIYYRRFQNAIAVVNAGGTSSQTATLPSGHSYTDLFGRSVSSPLTIEPNDGYVLETSNGCN